MSKSASAVQIENLIDQEEQKQQLAVINQVEAGLAALEEKEHGVLPPDCSTDEGMKQAPDADKWSAWLDAVPAFPQCSTDEGQAIREEINGHMEDVSSLIISFQDRVNSKAA